MGWSEYYRTVPESFCVQFGYDLLKRIFENRNGPAFPDGKSLNLVLGGFSPQTQTASSFVKYCQTLRPNYQDKFFLLDFNEAPMRRSFFNIYNQKGVSFIQADLTKLPFHSNSLDLIFLDGTTMFMDDEQVNLFLEQTNRVLTRNGLVVSSFRLPFLSQTVPLDNFMGKIRNRTPIYYRSEEQYRNLFSSRLRVVSLFDCGRNIGTLLAGRKDSPLKEFSGQSYLLYP